MRALTVAPGKPHSIQLENVAEPARDEGSVLVATHAVGICGTDHEIVEGKYGAAAPGQQRLTIGHEAVGRVLDAAEDSGLAAGDWVAGIVRHPDPVPCVSCAAGEWDMCRNGQYTERGIKERDGFARERFRTDASWLVKVPSELGELGALVEPASVLAKAWEQAERIGQRAVFRPERVLVTGAGPIGLLAALFGVQRQLDVHVLDRATSGAKPELVRALGATYHHGSVEELGGGWDLVFECTGAPALLFDVIEAAGATGIVCLTGVSASGQKMRVDPGALNRELVLENNVVFGTVNANRRHYEQAVECLSSAGTELLERLITRRVPLDDFERAFSRQGDEIKTLLTFA